MSTPIPALLVEAFTAIPCQGNGAAVVWLPQATSDGWMQRLARSLNQSETAFLLEGPNGWRLRWFTPTCEVPLCGHATLAALMALHHWGLLTGSGQTVFHTRSGPLTVGMEGLLGCIELPAASLQAAQAPSYLEGMLARDLGSALEGYWHSAIGYRVGLLPSQADLAGLSWSSVELESAEAQGLVLMQSLHGSQDAPRVLGQAADYQLRFFAPGLGIPEDPVTGSAHALVTPYWLKQTGRSRTVGWQCSPRPGGMMGEASSSGMIRLSGQGSVLWQGSLQLQPDGCNGAAERWQQLCDNG